MSSKNNEECVKYFYNPLSVYNKSSQPKKLKNPLLSISAPLNFIIEGTLKTDNTNRSNTNSESGSFHKSLNNKSNPKNNSSREQKDSLNYGKTTTSTQQDTRFKNINLCSDICDHNNISPVNSIIESNQSLNDSEQLQKLNDRLNHFMNNNFNYTKNDPSPLNSNKSNENDVHMDYLMNMMDKCDNQEMDFNYLDDAEYLLKKNEADLKSNLSNKQDLQSVVMKLLNKKRQPEIGPDCIKGFISNKFNDVLSNSNLSDKLLLYSLISNKSATKNNIENNYKDSCDLDTSFNKIFDHATIEKHFEKDVIRFTIENFCKYLKTNGYSIVKQNKNKNDSDGRINPKMKELKCPHTDKKHYAKNMCNACYHKQGRVKKASLCLHNNRTHYARGKCRTCYLNTYHKEQVKKKTEYMEDRPDSEDERDRDI